MATRGTHVINYNNDFNRFMNNLGHDEEDGCTMMMHHAHSQPWLLPPAWLLV
jgi:hypothetical protein